MPRDTRSVVEVGEELLRAQAGGAPAEAGPAPVEEPPELEEPEDAAETGTLEEILTLLRKIAAAVGVGDAPGPGAMTDG